MRRKRLLWQRLNQKTHLMETRESALARWQEVKKRRKTKKPDDDPVVNGDQRPAPKAVNKRKANPDVELKSALSAAESCISALGAVQPLQVWTGAIKVKEVDKRLDVAYHCQVSLEERMLLTDAAAQEAGKN